jgi:probable sporulation protein (polysaccharide deacetylase family)
MKPILRGTVLILFAALVWWFAHTDPVSITIANMKMPPEDQALLSRIKQEAEKKKVAPIDARVDRIWKAIPGLNGWEVDIDKTFSASKKSGKIKWVYRQVPPKVQLDQLGNYPIYRGNEHKKMVALMVNVAWGTEHVPEMLEIFRRENVKATFFLDGSWLKKNPEVARQILQAGHEIGNHAYSHPLMSQVPRERIESEIAKTEKLIQEILGVKSKWFAPPAGDFNQQVIDIASQHRMKTVLWTTDTVDWRKTSTPAIMVQRVEKQVGPGHLILMHPTDRTVEALPQIIALIKKKGLQLGTVEQVLSSERLEKIE